MVTIQFFAEAAEKYDSYEETLNEDKLDLVLLHLFTKNPAFKDYFMVRFPSVKLALNQNYIEEVDINQEIKVDELERFLKYYYGHIKLNEKDILAFIPPVSGG
ncbi:hypothetical protein K502DRAFT_348135 [Neoconidiobolus thromboides FSU 785]|nr:hypothetical protein K502DRAFT_348135 [Neoconidiobolus thromboides FSU 785]